MRKSFLTNLANEGVRDLVDWHVFFEVDGGGKRTLTQVTLEAFVSVEAFHVFDEVVSEGESFVAVVALPFVLKVKSEMLFEVSLTHCFTAHTTFCLVCRTCVGMVFQDFGTGRSMFI